MDRTKASDAFSAGSIPAGDTHMASWSKGEDAALSRPKYGFNSRRSCCGCGRTVMQRLVVPPYAGSKPVSHLFAPSSKPVRIPPPQGGDTGPNPVGVSKNRNIAQMAERPSDTREAGGSSPPAPISFI